MREKWEKIGEATNFLLTWQLFPFIFSTLFQRGMRGRRGSGCDAIETATYINNKYDQRCSQRHRRWKEQKIKHLEDNVIKR